MVPSLRFPHQDPIHPPLKAKLLQTKFIFFSMAVAFTHSLHEVQLYKVKVILIPYLPMHLEFKAETTKYI